MEESERIRSMNKFKANNPFGRRSEDGEASKPSPWVVKDTIFKPGEYQEKLRKEHLNNMKYDPDYARMFGGMKEGY